MEGVFNRVTTVKSYLSLNTLTVNKLYWRHNCIKRHSYLLTTICKQTNTNIL